MSTNKKPHVMGKPHLYNPTIHFFYLLVDFLKLTCYAYVLLVSLNSHFYNVVSIIY